MSQPGVLSVCNSALIKIGAERIVSLDDDSKAAVLCNEQFSKIRDDELRAHPWNFAVKRLELAELATPPAFGFAHAYQLPIDCLKILSVESSFPYVIEGRSLLTDAESAQIKYISQIEDVGAWDAGFREVVAIRLACDLAYAIAQSAKLGESMYALYERARSRARSMDAQEGSPQTLVIRDWLDARY
jgi:hypothetical protein